MRDTLRDWLDHRTGLVTGYQAWLTERLPGGAKWRYVFGHALAASFALQLVTGLLLMSSYVPSASQAWGSVWYIQNRMLFGWFIRGMHHFGSSAVMILLLTHLVQVVWTRAYRAPREFNWWIGLAMAGCILGLALTGYLLPWDMKGYWATKVATNIAGSTPALGPSILQVLVGGAEYGNQTLTRLFSLHVGVLPLAVIVLLFLHLKLYYRHGVAAPENAIGYEEAWPRQIVRNLIAVAAVIGLLTAYVVYQHGVTLEAPADSSVADYPARPEWYFLPLFQLLNYFQSPYEVIGTHILPGVLFGFLAALPLLDKALPRRLVHVAACLVMLGVVAGAGFLMTVALRADASNLSFQLARTKADGLRERANLLATAQGVPPDGAVYLLRRDPLTRGHGLLVQNCLSCHYQDGEGRTTRTEFHVEAAKLAGAKEPVAKAVSLMVPGFQPSGGPKPEARGSIAGFLLEGKLTTKEGSAEVIVPARVWASADGRTVELLASSPQTAADLAGFGTKAWIRGLLDNPSDPKYFGTAVDLDGMKGWKKGSKATPEQLDQIAEFVSKLAETADDATVETWFGDTYKGKLDKLPGAALFVKECGDCHVIGEPGLITEGGLAEAPDLFAYGSPRWIKQMIRTPDADTLYGYLESDHKMPAFGDQIPPAELDTLVRFLKGQYLRTDTAGQ